MEVQKMSDLQPWQREVSKVTLKQGERAFVTPDGTVIATNTTHPDFAAFAKKRFAEKNANRQTRINERLAKQKKRMEAKIANAAKREAEKEANQKKRLLKQQQRAQAQKAEVEKKLNQIEARLTK